MCMPWHRRAGPGRLGFLEMGRARRPGDAAGVLPEAGGAGIGAGGDAGGGAAGTGEHTLAFLNLAPARRSFHPSTMPRPRPAFSLARAHARPASPHTHARHMPSSVPSARCRSHASPYLFQVVDHYENPRNVGSMDKSDPNVGTGLVGAPACGDVMKLQIKVDEDGQITDAVFKTFGCGSAIASSSVATEWVKGRSLEDATTITNNQISSYLSLNPVKVSWGRVVGLGGGRWEG